MTSHECVRCGQPAEHLHHWAPIALFGRPEAEQWPTSWLCKTCHRYWHDVIARRRREDISALRGTRESAPETRLEMHPAFDREAARVHLREIANDLRERRKDLT